MINKVELLKTCLLNIVSNIDAGNTNITEEQCEDIIQYINKTTNVENKYSKYQSCQYLGLSRSTFDRYIKDGLISEGRKEAGFKEKFWYKKDLDNAKRKILNIHSNNGTSS